MIITRREILKAIRTEKLKEGGFIHLNKDELGYDDTCKVCAVGAVLRSAGVGNGSINIIAQLLLEAGYYSDEGDEHTELEAKRYLNALSVKFEKLASVYGAGKRTKDKLAIFIKKYFPKTINVEGL